MFPYVKKIIENDRIQIDPAISAVDARVWADARRDQKLSHFF